MEVLLGDVLSKHTCKRLKEACLGTERSWAPYRHERSLSQSHREFWNWDDRAVTSKWSKRVRLEASGKQSLDAGYSSCKMFPFGQQQALVWLDGVVPRSELSAVNLLSSWRRIGEAHHSIYLLHHNFSDMKRCGRGPQKDRHVFYTFCTLKWWLILPNFSPESLNQFILVSAMYKNAYFPTS